MARKDYELIANVLQSRKPLEEDFHTYDEYMIAMAQYQKICFEFAYKLKTTNENFNREKFLVACEVIDK